MGTRSASPRTSGIPLLAAGVVRAAAGFRWRASQRASAGPGRKRARTAAVLAGAAAGLALRIVAAAATHLRSDAGRTVLATGLTGPTTGRAGSGVVVAVADALGVWCRALPVTADTAARLVQAAAGHAHARRGVASSTGQVASRTKTGAAATARANATVVTGRAARPSVKTRAGASRASAADVGACAASGHASVGTAAAAAARRNAAAAAFANRTCAAGFAWAAAGRPVNPRVGVQPDELVRGHIVLDGLIRGHVLID